MMNAYYPLFCKNCSIFLVPLLLILLLPAAAEADGSGGEGLKIQNNPGLELSWRAAEGSRYSIEYKTDLLASEWALHNTAYLGENAVVTVSIGDILPNASPKGFFRLRIETTTDFIDTDSDAIPDWWEMYWFGHLEQGPKSNGDMDTIQLLDEYRFGLDPTQDDSVLTETQESYTYDFTLLTGASQSSGLSLKYAYDQAGNLIKVSR